MANTYLTRTTGTGSRRKFTKSVWFKRSKLGDKQDLFGHNASPNYNIEVQFKDDDTLRFYSYNNSSATVDFVTSRKFIDCNCWYHLVIAVDTEQSTEADRVKIYINGVQETSFSTADYPTLNEDLEISDGTRTGSIGAWYTGGDPYDGYMAYVAFIDGTQELPTIFGETDATTGEWKIKTTITPSSAWGTNGYLILKNGNTITDQSSNSNDWTSNGAGITKSEDNPSNVFATMNPLGTYDGSMASGNTSVTTDNSSPPYRYIASTLGVNKGKWYWEVKLKTQANYMLCGITDQPSFPASGVTMLGNGTYDCAVYTGNLTAGGGNGHLYHSSTSNADNTNTPGAFMGGLGTNDIITFALDLDSATKKLYIGVGGNWANGSGSTNQTFANASGVTIVAPSSTNTGFYFPACGDYSGTNGTFEYNFGNGYFGTTQVSSAGTNASGIGIFELDVPSGYTALSTKGLNL